MFEFEQQRQKMVEEQIIARGVQDLKVLQAMQNVARENFVDKELISFAYEDSPLPIGEGQTISQPYIVALMAEYAQLASQDKVLEIGTGSGYSAAILGQLASHVYSMERNPSLAEKAQRRLESLGYQNITVCVGDGTLGWEEFAPYDAILVTAGGPQIPPTLLKQLAKGGRLVIPVGLSVETQELIRVTRRDEQDYRYENLGGVRFVPLIGVEGWNVNP